MSTSAILQLSGDRVLERCDALARCSEQRDGLTRVYLSPQQRQANELVSQWMREAGLTTRLDAVGNILGRYEGDRPNLPCLMLGSHLDTVRDAGKYDGMLGVVAAIECVASLKARQRRLPFAVEVIGFADEEGVRFNATLIGSRAVAGTLDRLTLDCVDGEGTTLRDAMRQFGLDPELAGNARRARADVLAYAELHIEQGPVLEQLGLPVGVVTAINGATRFALEFVGMAGHAGTVPMSLRKDALAGAAEAALAVERVCADLPEVVGTVGKFEALPGAVNVIAGKVHMTLDVRAPQDALRRHAIDTILAVMREIAKRRSLGFTAVATHESPTAACAPWLQEQIATAIAAEGLAVRRLPSGAGHDGMAMIKLADIGMLFMRCKGGISHNPAEAVDGADVEQATRVLLGFIERFDAANRNAQ